MIFDSGTTWAAEGVLGAGDTETDHEAVGQRTEFLDSRVLTVEQWIAPPVDECVDPLAVAVSAPGAHGVDHVQYMPMRQGNGKISVRSVRADAEVGQVDRECCVLEAGWSWRKSWGVCGAGIGACPAAGEQE
jgi:hypothetical protein